MLLAPYAIITVLINNADFKILIINAVFVILLLCILVFNGNYN